MLTDALMKYAVFSGRARRKEFWGFVLLQLVLFFVAAFLDEAAGTAEDDRIGIFLGLTILDLLIPAWAVTVRRLHDTGRSGWWSLIGLVPLVGAVVMLVFLLIDSDPATNVYGPNPKSPSPVAVYVGSAQVPTPDRSAPASGWILSGFDAGGHRLRFSIGMHDSRFRENGLIVGREEGSADLTIASDSVSRRHARIFFSDDDLWIEDLNSTNGTVLNGHRLEQGRAGVFSNGAKLLLGDIELVLTRIV